MIASPEHPAALEEAPRPDVSGAEGLDVVEGTTEEVGSSLGNRLRLLSVGRSYGEMFTEGKTDKTNKSRRQAKGAAHVGEQGAVKDGRVGVLRYVTRRG